MTVFKKEWFRHINIKNISTMFINNVNPIYGLAIAAICLFTYVFIFTTPIPFLDSWEIIPLFENVSFNGLWQQHGEHRMFFPNLIYIALAKLSHWNIRYETGFHFLTFAVLAFLIYSAFKSQVNNKLARWIFCLAVLVEFSPINYEGLLHGFQLQVGLCYLMVYLAIMLIPHIITSMRSLMGLIFALIVASFSYFSGLLGWIVTIIAFIRLHGYKRYQLFVILNSFFITTAVFFSTGYNINFKHVNVDYTLSLMDKVWHIPVIFFVFMGANFIITTNEQLVNINFLLWLSGIWGIIFTGIGLYFIKKTWLYEKARTIIPYSMILFSILSAITVAYGRVDMGFNTGLYLRYHSIQMFYFIGVIWLMLIYFNENNKLYQSSKWFIMVFSFLIIFNWIGGTGVGYIRLKRIKPIEKELRTKGENISRSTAAWIYYDRAVMLDNIKILKKLKYNVFHEKNQLPLR